MSHTSHIEGIFRLKTPLHCAAPGEGQGNETRTMTMPVVTRSHRTYVPFFPANDLRGRLRRKAARLVMEALSSSGKISRELYSGLTCGAMDASPESDNSIEEIVRARGNLYMGVFGGGKRMLRSRFGVADLVPVVAATVDAGMVPKALAERTESTFTPMTSRDGALADVQGFELLYNRNGFKRDDAFSVARPEELEAYVDNVLVDLTRYQESVVAGRKERAEDKAKDASEKQGVKKTDVANWYTVQAIAPGTPMYFRLDMDDALTSAQVGILLQSLLDLMNEQALGGWSRCGFGRYAADLTLVRDGGRIPLLVAGDNGAYSLTPATAEYIEAMREELAQQTAAELSAFFMPIKPAKEKKAGAKKAA